MIMKAESAPPLAAVVGAARWCGGAVVESRGQDAGYGIMGSNRVSWLLGRSK